MSDLVTRVAVLETHVDHMRSDLGKLTGVPADLADIKARVEHLPTKDYLADQFARQFNRTAGIVGLIAALVTIVNVVARLLIP